MVEGGFRVVVVGLWLRVGLGWLWWVYGGFRVVVVGLWWV